MAAMSTTPPWGTPNPAELWPPSRTDPGGDLVARAAGGSEEYVVVIEQQTGSGESMVWRVDPEPFSLPAGATRLQAQDLALHLARTFTPRHPMSQRGRQSLLLSPDSYLVLVQGATRTFHFRVSVAEVV
jgi:hypothetical protein